jgi:hypothetical protein
LYAKQSLVTVPSRHVAHAYVQCPAKAHPGGAREVPFKHPLKHWHYSKAFLWEVTPWAGHLYKLYYYEDQKSSKPK